MLIKENEHLERYVTFRIGGYTSKMYIPESEEELIEVVTNFNNRREKYYLLGNGSNVLITDKMLSRKVILNTKSCNYINFKENGIVEVGASVDIRKLIKQGLEKNLEIPVALYTIPATMGGAIFQNASRGSFKVSISDNLLSVKYFDGEKICTFTKEECKFKWRYSIFHEHRNWVILGATFQFNKQSKEIGEKKLKESLDAAAEKS
jgi:UDP-N-acetylmuramate dehydrogenase